MGRRFICTAIAIAIATLAISSPQPCCAKSGTSVFSAPMACCDSSCGMRAPNRSEVPMVVTSQLSDVSDGVDARMIGTSRFHLPATNQQHLRPGRERRAIDFSSDHLIAVLRV
jgi:hypothetical protein